ncbi:MAG: enoyl-CoA hydratase-related protein [Pseudomonadota bacterium]
MEFENVKFSVEGNVAEVTLNRPQAANAMNLDMMKELAQIANRCDSNPDIRAVVLTGEGKMFSAGGDINAFGGLGDDLAFGLKEMTTLFHASVSRFTRMNAPLIVAANGMCAGGGMSLAAVGDIVLAADNSAFTMAYTAAALSPDGSSTYFLPRRIGDRRTRELMLTNRRISAQEALDWGLVNAIHPADSLLDEARKLAAQLAAGPTLAFGRVKQLLNASFENGLETQMELESRGIADMAATADTKEGVDAFLNKRKPVYQGR